MEKKNYKFDVLSTKEEMNLSKEEQEQYYRRLRAYCCNRKLRVTTKGATSIAPKLKGITGKIARTVTKMLAGGEYIQDIKGIENIPEGPVIFASTHQGILDGFVWIPSCPKHAMIVHGKETNKLLLMAQVNTGLILVTKNKERMAERIEAKLDMMTVLLRGHSIYICPETTWNLSPNKLHLPINYGFIDVAKKIGVPICPLMLNYTYSNENEKERITHIDIHYGKPIYVLPDDNVIDKLNEYSESVSTMRYNAMEAKGILKRNDITNMEYINYVKGNLQNLSLGKIDIKRERAGIQGAQEEFYVFHHLNDIPFDDEGNLLDTEMCETLKVLNRVHGI